MIQMSLHQVAAIMGGSLVGKEARIQGVCIDSRADCKGKLFIALKGEHFNGEAFCQDAVDKGAVAVVVSTAVEVTVPQIICHDALSALQALATAWARQLDAKIIAVTGSNGKTTVKNMLFSVLSQKYSCFATSGNLNNEIGVPLSLLSIHKSDEVAVIEMGAAQLGDIKLLTDMVQPDIALITNVSQAHIGRFGSEQNVAKAKGEIYQALSAQGVAVINQDSLYSTEWLNNLKSRKVSFGEAAQADFQLIKSVDGYQVKTQHGDLINFKLTVLGHHNYLNACAVIAIACTLDLSVNQIIMGLSAFKAEKGRLNVLKKMDLQVIDDSYNANPASMLAAIDVLKTQTKPTVLIIGDMAELGDESKQRHIDIGCYARATGVDQILAVGEYAEAVCENNQACCCAFNQLDELLNYLKEHPLHQGTVLVKGSRSMKLEQVVDVLMTGERR